MSEEPGRVLFENRPDQILLLNKAAEKSDQGRYNLTMKNEMGQDTVAVNVIVVGMYCKNRKNLEAWKKNAWFYHRLSLIWVYHNDPKFSDT